MSTSITNVKEFWKSKILWTCVIAVVTAVGDGLQSGFDYKTIGIAVFAAVVAVLRKWFSGTELS